MDDLDRSNNIDENLVYGKGLSLEENIGYSHWTISNVLLCYKITIVENGWETLLFV